MERRALNEWPSLVISITARETAETKRNWKLFLRNQVISTQIANSNTTIPSVKSRECKQKHSGCRKTAKEEEEEEKKRHAKHNNKRQLSSFWSLKDLITNRFCLREQQQQQQQPATDAEVFAVCCFYWFKLYVFYSRNIWTCVLHQMHYMRSKNQLEFWIYLVSQRVFVRVCNTQRITFWDKKISIKMHLRHKQTHTHSSKAVSWVSKSRSKRA